MHSPRVIHGWNMATRVLFLCTGNSCRSQMAEALLRQIGGDGFEALSAGSHPAGFVHSLALEAMRRMDVPVANLVSKSWNEFADRSVDAVITLCDDAAEELCPAWPGDPLCVHWSLPDPAYFVGSEEDRIEFTLRVAERLAAKIRGLAAMDWSQPRRVVEERLEFLGEI